MKIAVAEMRAMANLLFDRMEKAGCSVVEFSEDYYWDFNGDERYNPGVDPGKPGLGQLSDDLVDTRKLLTGSVEPSSHEMVHLSSILRLVGDKALF